MIYSFITNLHFNVIALFFCFFSLYYFFIEIARIVRLSMYGILINFRNYVPAGICVCIVNVCVFIEIYKYI